MRNPQKAIEKQIQKAVELRATGADWDQVASALKRKRAAVERLPIDHPEIWEREHERVERELETQLAAEGLFIFRELLRSENEKTKCCVLGLMIRLHIENERNRLKSKQLERLRCGADH